MDWEGEEGDVSVDTGKTLRSLTGAELSANAFLMMGLVVALLESLYRGWRSKAGAATCD